MYGIGSPILEFEYFDEVGTGLGPTLEFYSLVSKKLQSSKLNIWMEESVHSSDTTNTLPSTDEIKSGDDLVKSSRGLFPKPISPKLYQNNHKQFKRIYKLFKFLGLFVGRALYDSRLLDLSFNDAFLKLIRGENLTFEDLSDIDPTIYKQLKKMKELVQKN